ncbi:MAG: hypothetical protein SWO11_01830 [Thermodesulfobacteriota bacterium]|nr:hypothetical protein [Thermodesulfobacteriota bacterium]
MKDGLQYLNTFEIEVVRSFVAELKDKLGSEIVKIFSSAQR